MSGGTGDDLYTVCNINDIVTENSGEGTDTIFAEVSYTASDNVENLYLYGSSNINATGNTLDNNLRGNSGNNTLEGESGDDILRGGAGNDTLNGGSGK